MQPDQLLLQAVMMPAAVGLAVMLLASGPWACVAECSPGPRRQSWSAGIGIAAALALSLAVSDGLPWASAWSSWKMLYVAAAIVGVGAAISCVRGIEVVEAAALGSAACVLWFSVPEAKELWVRTAAAAGAAALSLALMRGMRHAPSAVAAAVATSLMALGIVIGIAGSSKVAAAAVAVAAVAAAGALAMRMSRTFSCASAIVMAGAGIGVALALYGRGYHDSVPEWLWWALVAAPASVALAVRRRHLPAGT